MPFRQGALKEPVHYSTLRTVQQAADELIVSVSTVRRLLAEGAFPNAFRISRKAIRIPCEDLETYRRAVRLTRAR